MKVDRLGVDPWNCYWEWVLQPALVRYSLHIHMHRPPTWAVLQFVGANSSTATSAEDTAGISRFPGGMQQNGSTRLSGIMRVRTTALLLAR